MILAGYISCHVVCFSPAPSGVEKRQKAKGNGSRIELEQRRLEILERESLARQSYMEQMLAVTKEQAASESRIADSLQQLLARIQ